MPPFRPANAHVSPDLLKAIAAFPLSREVRHCGAAFRVSPFDLYATCPACGTRLKVRSFSAATGIEDIFDAVMEWRLRPGAEAVVRRRQAEIAADRD